MASLGGQEIFSNNDAAENTTKRPESRESSMERKVTSLNKNAHASNAATPPMDQINSSTLHWFAQVGVEDDSIFQASKDRDEKLRYARERQNEERQKKIEEIKAQAEAAQKYLEQKEEERRRRIEEMRQRDTEKRHQVEERKRAIMEAEKERREYILKKNLERDSRIEVKKRDRNSIAFAFGSSTPRLLEPADFGMVSPSTFWGQRRSTSISNVAGASLSRRSSERELVDSSGAKKRAISASGTERHDDHRRKSSSMYEVFNWGYSNDEPPKRFSLSIASNEINIDGPPTRVNLANTNSSNSNTTTNYSQTSTSTAHRLPPTYTNYNNNNSYSIRKEEHSDTSPIVFRSVARRKTDLMPTMPSPRDGHYGSRSSLSTTPRTPGRAFSMNRLDQLAQPIRRNGEHIRAILERERRERELEMLDETASLGGGRRVGSGGRSKRAGSAGPSGSSSATGIMSRSMTHLAGGGGSNHNSRGKYSIAGGISTNFRPLGNGNRDSCKSMIHINNSWSSTPTTPTQRSNLGLQTAATKKYLQSSLASSASATKRGQQHYISTNPYRFDPNSLLLMNSSSLLVNAGSRSGNVTPGGHISTSRPGSAMSTSTTMSTSGFVARRPVPAQRKPRPASIAGTGVSLEEINKLKRENNRPPVKAATSSNTSSAQTTPKRTSNLMSTSMIVTSSSSRLSSAEKKTPIKKEPPLPKSNSASKTLTKTASSERINKLSKDTRPKGISNGAAMAKSMIVTSTNSETQNNNNNNNNGTAKATLASTESNIIVGIEAPAVPIQSKEEKDALNIVRTEEESLNSNEPQKVEALQHNADETKISAKQEHLDEGNEKLDNEPEVTKKPRSKENSVVRELTPPSSQTVDGNDLMSTSMVAKKITTEEEAKAALAERRRMAREEAERQAELERQREEADNLAELKRQEEEAERQRLFEEESTRLAEEQRRAEEERLRIAIEEAKKRETEERLKREEEERQRIEREEAEKKAKEEAERQRIEVAERLKREEKEREERRKRVEAIMARTRKGNSAANTPKATNDSETTATVVPNPTTESANSEDGSTSTSGSSSTTATTPTPIPSVQSTNITSTTSSTVGENLSTVSEPQNSQAMYEQSVVDKENALINSFSNMVIDENAKNLQQSEVSNGKLHADFTNSDDILQNTSTGNNSAVANGNGHFENVNNKNDINLLQDVVAPAANQLIDLSIESQDLNNPLNFNNNNSLLTTTTTTSTLVTADSHENKDISLL